MNAIKSLLQNVVKATPHSYETAQGSQELYIDVENKNNKPDVVSSNDTGKIKSSVVLPVIDQECKQLQETIFGKFYDFICTFKYLFNLAKPWCQVILCRYR